MICSNLFAQECLIDGKNMYSIGSSEIVNGELLSLFRCDEGHQMWLTNYDEENTQKYISKNIVDIVQLDSLAVYGTVSLVTEAIEPENTTMKSTEETIHPIPITKTEKVLKLGSASTNYTNDINIKKFGVETLLHKKIESDRVFAEAIEEEKNELLYIMKTQKRLFDIAERSNLKFRPFEDPIKLSIYLALSAILFLSL